jgi:hypothetical protein
MSLATPPRVQKLQKALHDKAKTAPGYRFYSLYDKVYRPEVLMHAYLQCRSNDGTAGVDGQTFADISAQGVWNWLDALANRTYRPQPVRRVWIPKPDGTQRPFLRAAVGGAQAPLRPEENRAHEGGQYSVPLHRRSPAEQEFLRSIHRRKQPRRTTRFAALPERTQ